MKAVVRELVPGQVVTIGDVSATVVLTAPHPLYRNLAMVVWRMPDRSWSHDALSWDQVVGDTEILGTDELRANLRGALGP